MENVFLAVLLFVFFPAAIRVGCILDSYVAGEYEAQWYDYSCYGITVVFAIVSLIYTKDN